MSAIWSSEGQNCNIIDPSSTSCLVNWQSNSTCLYACGRLNPWQVWTPLDCHRTRVKALLETSSCLKASFRSILPHTVLLLFLIILVHSRRELLPAASCWPMWLHPCQGWKHIKKWIFCHQHNLPNLNLWAQPAQGLCFCCAKYQSQVSLSHISTPSSL